MIGRSRLGRRFCVFIAVTFFSFFITSPSSCNPVVVNVPQGKIPSPTFIHELLATSSPSLPSPSSSISSSSSSLSSSVSPKAPSPVIKAPTSADDGLLSQQTNRRHDDSASGVYSSPSAASIGGAGSPSNQQGAYSKSSVARSGIINPSVITSSKDLTVAAGKKKKKSM